MADILSHAAIFQVQSVSTAQTIICQITTCNDIHEKQTEPSHIRLSLVDERLLLTMSTHLVMLLVKLNAYKYNKTHRFRIPEDMAFRMEM